MDQVTKEQTASWIAAHEKLRTIWNAGAAGYDRCPGHALRTDRERQAWQRVLERTLQPISAAAPVRILDVGAGTGTMSTLLAAMGYEVTAVDLAPRMLEQARVKADILGVSLQLVEANAERLPFVDNSFDMLFSRHLFWTLTDPHEALREWVRVVRPGGIVAIADGWWNEPSAGMRRRRAVGRVIRKVVPSSGLSNPGYDRDLTKQLPVSDGVSPYSIRYYLDQAGLERLKVRDLASIRDAERRAMPPWLWIDRARHTWLATGYKPDS